MGRTIKLILYYFAYQFAVAIPGMFGYTIWKCFETQSFDLHNAPTSLAIILSLLGTLLMAWHLIHYKYVKLDKQTLASLPLHPYGSSRHYMDELAERDGPSPQYSRKRLCTNEKQCIRYFERMYHRSYI